MFNGSFFPKSVLNINLTCLKMKHDFLAIGNKKKTDFDLFSGEKWFAFRTMTKKMNQNRLEPTNRKTLKLIDSVVLCCKFDPLVRCFVNLIILNDPITQIYWIQISWNGRNVHCEQCSFRKKFVNCLQFAPTNNLWKGFFQNLATRSWKMMNMKSIRRFPIDKSSIVRDLAQWNLLLSCCTEHKGPL